MAEWRNGGMAERMAEWSNGGNGYIHTLVACWKTNPSLSWLERLVGQKKLDGESCYVARRYLIFSFLASSDFRRQSRMSDRNGYIRTIYGTHRRRRHTLIFYSIDRIYVQYKKKTRGSHVSILKRLYWLDISCGTWEAIQKCDKSDKKLETRWY